MLARDLGPVAHAAGVEMHPGIVGVGVIADAARLQAQTDVADRGDRDVGDREVHRPAAHMLAVLGDTARAPRQHGVGAWGTIGRDDMDGSAGAGGALHFPEDIEQGRVHAGRLVLTPVAKQPVQLLQAGAAVGAVLLEGDGLLLLGMRMIDRERARRALGHGILGRPDADEGDGDAGDRNRRGPAAASCCRGRRLA